MDEFKDEEIRMHELKQRAKAYYATGGDGDGVLIRIEEILNAMFYDKPEDVFGHLVRASVLTVLFDCLFVLFCLADMRKFVHFFFGHNMSGVAH